MSRDLTNDELVAILVGLVVAMIIVPATIPELGSTIGAWLIEHAVLVDPDQAVLTIPGFSAGADTRRLVILAAALIAVFLAGWVRWRTRTVQEQP